MSNNRHVVDVPAEKIIMYAERVVELWESIEQRADDFQKKFGTTDNARVAYAEACRQAAGGEEVYELCRKLLTQIHSPK